MITCLGKSCSYSLRRMPFVNWCQFMYLVISLLLLRAGYRIWLYQFLIFAYLFTLHWISEKFELGRIWSIKFEFCALECRLNFQWLMESPRSVSQSWSNFIYIISGMGERLLLGFGADSIQLRLPWQQKTMSPPKHLQFWSHLRQTCR